MDNNQLRGCQNCGAVFPVAQRHDCERTAEQDLNITRAEKPAWLIEQEQLDKKRSEPFHPDGSVCVNPKACDYFQHSMREEVKRDGTVGEVIDGRTSVYGEVIPAFTRQAQAISAVLGHEVQPWEVPLIMVAVKLIRTTEAPDYSDNSDDIEGYLDIFRQLIGDDMIEARSVKEYIEKRGEK